MKFKRKFRDIKRSWTLLFLIWNIPRIYFVYLKYHNWNTWLNLCAKWEIRAWIWHSKHKWKRNLSNCILYKSHSDLDVETYCHFVWFIKISGQNSTTSSNCFSFRQKSVTNLCGGIWFSYLMFGLNQIKTDMPNITFLRRPNKFMHIWFLILRGQTFIKLGHIAILFMSRLN